MVPRLAARDRYVRVVLLAVVAIAVGLAAGWRAGGGLKNLVQVQVSAVGLLVAGAVLETVSGLWLSGPSGRFLLAAGYVLLAGWVIANIRWTGMVLVLIGLLANMAVMAVDDGMPVRGVAPGSSLGWRHHPVGSGDHLTALADVVQVPLLSETVSGGDIVMLTGAAVVSFSLIRPRPDPGARRRRVGAPGRSEAD